jgi:hypothetical protein
VQELKSGKPLYKIQAETVRVFREFPDGTFLIGWKPGFIVFSPGIRESLFYVKKFLAFPYNMMGLMPDFSLYVVVYAFWL